MPTIEISKKDLENLCGKKFSLEKLKELLEFVKTSIESIEEDKITLKIEDTNRADLLSVEGIARELKAITGKEKGLVNYEIIKSNFVVKVDKKVKKVRPYTACAVVKDLCFNHTIIEQIIQLQEKLSETFGRKRKDAAIGIYDFDKIKWPITYTTFKPDSISFVPLGFVEKLTLKEIIEKHEKGKLYGHLLEKAKEYPIFIDANNEVLSMPPIINSEYSGKITTETRNVFIEVSGFRLEKLLHVLNIVVSALAERKGKIYAVEIHDTKKFFTPIFATRRKVLKLEDINSLLGLELNPKQVIKLLQKMRYNAKEKKGKIIAEIPFYREDVIHNVDIIEDIAIAYGYKNFKPRKPQIFTEGKLLEESEKKQEIKELLIGLGFQEINSFIMSNKKEQFENMNSKPESFVKIKNPVSETFTCLRKSLLPSLLKFFSNNTTKEMPQKIFEIAPVVEPNERKETKTEEKNKIAVAITHARANFTEILQVLDYIMNNLKKQYQLEKKEFPWFIAGRSAEILVEKKSIGFLGEIAPQVLENWNLKMPIAAFELCFDDLL
ncbi:MAG: phenylalanine--tRNA ligase subunit beta [Candidatus Pacearchaeota archaeon]|nr:phenylalanine--tRNA ligase subunit beta [Candidatus Pacearchaeota archaeon]